MEFNGKTAIVTGSTRGIGKTIADLLVEFGCEVIYTGTSAKAKVKGKYLQLDLADEASLKYFIKRTEGLQKIGILINNAGINMIEPIQELNIDNFEKIIKINLTGCAQLMKEFSRKMIKTRVKGKILNMSSIFGVISKEKRNSYSASKTGLIGLTRSAALDLAPYGILVNALCPGFTKTDLTASMLSKNELASLSAQVPLGRFAQVSEIAKAAIFLCSDANSYMTGQALIVDGGFTIQ